MSRKRVLVVDDNEHNREYARQVLAEGWEVASAADGVDALERIGESTPDLIVLDLSMPRLDGWGVVRKLREQPETRSLVVVACSAHAMAGDRERALTAGFDGYIAKPYRPTELIECVESFLGPGEVSEGSDDDWGGDDWSLADGDWEEEA